MDYPWPRYYMKKTAIFKLVKYLCISIFVIYYVRYNIMAHSLYYARYLPHAYGEPIITMMIDNFHAIDKPYGDGVEYCERCIEHMINDTKFYSYHHDELRIDYDEEPSGRIYTFKMRSSGDLKPSEVTYYFNRHFDLIKAYDEDNHIYIEPDQVDVQYVISEIYKRLYLFVDADELPPLINLQPIYNLIYWKNFN